MKLFNSRNSLLGFTALSTQLLYLMSFIGSAASTDNVPHPKWKATAFRLADDTDSDPLSAFILSLDPNVFRNVTEVSNGILEKCTNLVSTAVDSWDNQSIDFHTLREYPSGIWRTQAEAYQTFANYNFGTPPTKATLNCINDALKPFYHTTPIIDWNWSAIGIVTLLTLIVCCVFVLCSGVLYSAKVNAGGNSSTIPTEKQRLFNSKEANNTHYGSTTTETTIDDKIVDIEKGYQINAS